MADIFISYKSEDRAIAGLYAEALSAGGLSVWWDPVLRTGEIYDDIIERNLREARLVVVLWSPRSVKSKWVRAEATIGERKGALLPVLIEACDRPIAFELLQTADLTNWSGDRADARWRDFIADVQGALQTRQAQERAHAAPPPPDALTIETLFWSSIKDGNDAADFEAYAQRYPHGHFVDIARNKLRTSRSESSHPSPLAGEGQGRGVKAPSSQAIAPTPPPPTPSPQGGGDVFPPKRPAWLIPAAIAGALVFAGFSVSRLFPPPQAGEAAREEVGAPASSRQEEGRQDAGGPRLAGQEFDDCSGANWCPRMVVIPGGSFNMMVIPDGIFNMGSPHGETGRATSEGPQRRVSIRQFAVGKFEVTFGQWAGCVNRGGCTGNANPSDQAWGRGNRPVINVSWNDALEYVQWLSRDTRQTYRLLSEAEWEYAARAGTATAYSTGSTITTSQANFNNTLGRTQSVGAYAANAFGLHDMHGNVWEWVQDCYASSYSGLPTDGSANETGACSDRVLRGGSWDRIPEYLRSAVRVGVTPPHGEITSGFRVARSLS